MYARVGKIKLRKMDLMKEKNFKKRINSPIFRSSSNNEGEIMRCQEDLYHACTNGLSQDLMFCNADDFREGMNDIPVCALSVGIKIYAFCLMNNHVHFLLKGQYDDCLKFMRLYKQMRSRRLRARHGAWYKLRGADISVVLLDSAEYQLNAIAYVLRNPVAAGIAVMPGEYKWSSASLYFGDKAFCLPGCKKMSELSVREKFRMLKSRISFPDHYIVDSDGMIFPGSYTEYESVARMFGSPKQLLFYETKNQDLTSELETGIVAKTKYKDEELLCSLDWLSGDKFHGRKYRELRIEDRYKVAKELHRRYGCSVKQTARVTGCSPEILKALF